MKNLMIFISPDKCFAEDHAQLAKIQIEISLMFWNAKDILLVTNFPYEYGNIKAQVVPDSLYCEHRKRASKINAILHLIKKKIVKGLVWFHDFDAFQLEDLPEDILGDKDAAFTTYGFNNNWNTGSFFFRPEALDIFEMIKKVMDDKRINEEQALGILTDANTNNINSRYKILNPTYNLGQKWSSELVYSIAEKPIRVLHFHPQYQDVYDRVKPIIPDFLMQRLKKHGY